MLRRVCPRCGLRLDRGEPDHYFGGMVLNFVVVESAIIVGAFGAAWATWPDVPWRAITWTFAALAVTLPLAFYPLARTLWLATDLVFRPPQRGDFAPGGPEGETERPGADRP